MNEHWWNDAQMDFWLGRYLAEQDAARQEQIYAQQLHGCFCDLINFYYGRLRHAPSHGEDEQMNKALILSRVTGALTRYAPGAGSPFGFFGVIVRCAVVDLNKADNRVKTNARLNHYQTASFDDEFEAGDDHDDAAARAEAVMLVPDCLTEALRPLSRNYVEEFLLFGRSKLDQYFGRADQSAQMEVAVCCFDVLEGRADYDDCLSLEDALDADLLRARVGKSKNIGRWSLYEFLRGRPGISHQVLKAVLQKMRSIYCEFKCSLRASVNFRADSVLQSAGTRAGNTWACVG